MLARTWSSRLRIVGSTRSIGPPRLATRLIAAENIGEEAIDFAFTAARQNKNERRIG